jgi:uncharacterized protein YjbI with pentapeptide repeats
MNIDELQTSLEQHALWVMGEAGGAQADLSKADLSGADLYGAKLYGVVGDMNRIRSLQLDTWPIVWTDAVMQIGCQRHTIDAWWAFTDEEISRMEPRALAWWKKWKPYIRQMVELSLENADVP